ncbi:hypothetical protein OESDEN_18995 [Oesophagostomum dentatum]|uniref:Uncharacterized protein n=1 Tax=Oesophagostomum dentatum TaxID=61180 RepID=A0A0B1S8P8_OESDE|nr:hypothetical protein OESDEN_18995 [Oesophagostomum dentatum]
MFYKSSMRRISVSSPSRVLHEKDSMLR